MTGVSRILCRARFPDSFGGALRFRDYSCERRGAARAAAVGKAGSPSVGLFVAVTASRFAAGGGAPAGPLDVLAGAGKRPRSPGVGRAGSGPVGANGNGG